MKKALILAFLVVMLSVCVSAGPVTFSVGAAQTFLYQASPDVDQRAIFIQLTCPISGPSPQADDCINAAAGTILQLTAVGQQCYFGTAGTCTEVAASLGGVFDSTDTEAASASLTAGNVNRLGAANTFNVGQPDINTVHTNTSSTNVSTTIPNDFFIPTISGAVGNIATLSPGGISVVVPTGANFLVIGVLDSFYKDNTDISGTLGIQINVQSPVPEPATLGLLGFGLTALGLLRRRTR